MDREGCVHKLLCPQGRNSGYYPLDQEDANGSDVEAMWQTDIENNGGEH